MKRIKFSFFWSPFSKKGKILNEIFLLAEDLEKKLFWVPSCTNGMDTITEFFQTICPIQDKFEETIKPRMEGLKFKKERHKNFIAGFTEFIHNAGHSKYGWCRTKTGEIPFSINIYIHIEHPWDIAFSTRSVAEHIGRRNNPKKETNLLVEKSFQGKWNETGFIENQLVNPFMQKYYQLLQRIVKEF